MDLGAKRTTVRSAARDYTDEEKLELDPAILSVVRDEFDGQRSPS
jgi:hypothetical protein